MHLYILLNFNINVLIIFINIKLNSFNMRWILILQKQNIGHYMLILNDIFFLLTIFFKQH